MPNQNPEQLARDMIDRKLSASGWVIQDKSTVNLNAASGVAIREYSTEVGPADYVLFVDKKPVGVIEAKRIEEGHRLTVHEEQSEEYAKSRLKYLKNDPLPYVYESTGEVTRFTNYLDPKPRSTPVFSFHKPETFRLWAKLGTTLRHQLLCLPALPKEGLRDCQISAIEQLEHSFKLNKPRALIQMATGSGKTFTAITFIYRLLKHAGASRILFLVDTRNLGEQAEQEFMAYRPADENRKFTELYGVHRLKSRYIPSDNQVYISTIQRLYSILKGTELDETTEDENPAERWLPKEPVPVGYNEKLPIEYFDFIVIDECHRSIYNLWKQVLEYFDAFQIGLTATPDDRTFGYFHQNVVSEYTHEQAVADGVNVGYNVFQIETKITKHGATIWKGEYIDRREKLTHKKRWEQLDEDETYDSKRLDEDIVNPNQISTVIRAFKDHLPEMFPDRYNEAGEFEVPKTLIFAKTDSHADDIIQTVREEFGEENKFCKKLTYKTEEDPKSVLAQFRNNYYPRIAVTVDMVATGTDVKPLECLLFMRDVKSRNYFEQMKGRGTRTLGLDDLKKVTPSAKLTKDHFVVVDAIGVTESLKTDSRPLEKKPGVPLKDLLGAVAMGVREEEVFTTLAGRLARLDRQITDRDRQGFIEKTGGHSIAETVKALLHAYDPETIEAIRQSVVSEMPNASPDARAVEIAERHQAVLDKAASVFTGDVNQYLDNVRKSLYQIIDTVNTDEVLMFGWGIENRTKAEELVRDFKTWIEERKSEITALQIFYDQPYRRRELTYRMIKEVVEIIHREKPALAPLHVWKAYERLEEVQGSPKSELVALVSLLRKVSGIDAVLTSFDHTVDKNFQDWAFRKQAGALKFNEEQMQWLRMMKDHIAASFTLDLDDLNTTPFDAFGGAGKMYKLFGSEMNSIIAELNETLAA